MNPATHLAVLLAEEAAKARKLEIIFGKWWRHYAVPYEFRWTLYEESSTCPYCGEPLQTADPDAEPIDNALENAAHLDHMDPISKGGEDSIRNSVYVCPACNLAKRNRLFADWLNLLTPAYRNRAWALYLGSSQKTENKAR